MKNLNKLGNKGFSLVEMLVSVLITAILMLGIVIFLSTSRQTYETVSTSAKLQEEAQTLNTFTSEMMMEAVNFCWETAAVSYSSTDRNFEGEVNVLVIEARDNNKTDYSRSFYFIVHEKPDDGSVGVVRYKKYDDTSGMLKIEGTGSSKHLTVNSTSQTLLTLINDVYDNPYALIAENVESIQHEDTRDNATNITFNLKFNGTEFVSSLSILSRNTLEENKAAVPSGTPTPTP